MNYKASTAAPRRDAAGQVASFKMRGKMATDVCKFWRGDAGYGFFVVEGGLDLFFHASQVRRAGYTALTQGQRARFNIGSNARTGKPMAVDVELMEPIISPQLSPKSFRAEQSEHRDEHRVLAQAVFAKR
jgi:cold shock CspA family protein